MSNNHPKTSTRPRRRKRLLAAAALAASVTMIAGQTTTASAGPIKRGDDGKSDTGIRTRATFSEPGSRKIVNHLENLITATPENETIRVAAWRLQDSQITQALTTAAVKGVHVQVLVTHSAVHGQRNPGRDRARTLQKDLNKSSDSHTWMKVCGESNDSSRTGGPDGEACHGTHEMHSKFFLFTKTSGSSNVTAIGTANMNKDTVGGTGGWNSFYTDVGNKGLHTQYTKYFKDLVKSAKKGSSDANYYQTNPPKITGDVKSYFYPRDKGDTVVNTLKEVKCRSNTKIRIGAWSFSRVPIAKELRQLAKNGCSIEIVTNRFDPQVCTALFRVADGPGPGDDGNKPRGMKVKGFSKSKSAEGIHTKDMMIDGNYLNKNTKVVFTGSMNLNNTSLRHSDETAIRILNNDRIHDAYVKNFKKIQKDANITATDEKSCNKITA